jgi:hypothetical protein
MTCVSPINAMNNSLCVPLMIDSGFVGSMGCTNNGNILPLGYPFSGACGTPITNAISTTIPVTQPLCGQVAVNKSTLDSASSVLSSISTKYSEPTWVKTATWIFVAVVVVGLISLLIWWIFDKTRKPVPPPPSTPQPPVTNPSTGLQPPPTTQPPLGSQVNAAPSQPSTGQSVMGTQPSVGQSVIGTQPPLQGQNVGSGTGVGIPTSIPPAANGLQTNHSVVGRTTGRPLTSSYERDAYNSLQVAPPLPPARILPASSYSSAVPPYLSGGYSPRTQNSYIASTKSTTTTGCAMDRISSLKEEYYKNASGNSIGNINSSSNPPSFLPVRDKPYIAPNQAPAVNFGNISNPNLNSSMFSTNQNNCGCS